MYVFWKSEAIAFPKNQQNQQLTAGEALSQISSFVRKMHFKERTREGEIEKDNFPPSPLTLESQRDFECLSMRMAATDHTRVHYPLL